MISNTVQAILLVLCAALMNAAYALPMKLNKKWQWEHTWFAFSILGVAVVPTIIALFTVPKLWSTYSTVSTGTLAAMVLFGASWGVSLVFFGLALTRLGLAITFAVCLGTSAAVGALTPLIARTFRPDYDAPRRPDHHWRPGDYPRCSALRAGGKAQRSCIATAKCQRSPRFLGRMPAGFYFLGFSARC